MTQLDFGAGCVTNLYCSVEREQGCAASDSIPVFQTAWSPAGAGKVSLLSCKQLVCDLIKILVPLGKGALKLL